MSCGCFHVLKFNANCVNGFACKVFSLSSLSIFSSSQCILCVFRVASMCLEVQLVSNRVCGGGGGYGLLTCLDVLLSQGLKNIQESCK